MLEAFFHRCCQLYDKLAWRNKATKMLLILTILFYPFNLFPYGPFLKLTLYPLLALFLLNFDRLILLTLKNTYFRYIAIVATLWFTWMLISLCFAIGPSAIERENFIGIINDVKRFVPWYTFVGCCFILPRDEVKILLYWAFVGLFGYCACYSILEYLHFAGFSWATDFLSLAIKGFMSTELGEWTGGNFWPPILWDSERYRSVFEEPAYFAVLLGFCTLLFTYVAWLAKSWRSFWGNIVLAGIAAVLLCQTRGAAGAISLSVASVVWVFLALCFAVKMSRTLCLRMIIIAVFLFGASFFTLTTQRHASSHITSLAKVSTSTELEDVEHAKTTRSIHLSVELQCISASPIYGCGVGEYGNVMRDALRGSKDKTHEIDVWVSREDDPPKLNLFTGLAVTYGIVGLLLFMAWFAFPIIIFWFKRLKTSSIESCCIVPALGFFIACQMTSASTEIFSYFLLMTIPLLLIMDETDSKISPHVKKEK